MTYVLAADLVVLLHLGFLLFVVLGAFLVLRRPRLAWLHLPAVAWGAMIELSGWTVCPVTPLENALRRAAGAEGYSGGFIDHYILPLIYPPGLTRPAQVGLGVLVLGLNLALYAIILARHRRQTRRPGCCRDRVG
jgi:hypothetical protein